MATVTGNLVRQGMRIKVDGRWHTVTSKPEHGIVGGEPYPRLLVAQARDSNGSEKLIQWFTDDVLPAGATTATVVTFDWHHGSGQFSAVTVEIVYRKRQWGGWEVKRADNGRDLGWVVQPYKEKTWDAHVTSAAFRGTGPDDEGNLLDDVSAYLYNGVTGRPAECHAVAEGCRGRDEAAQEMIRHLYAKSAPAVGFGPHYLVRPWASRVR